MKKILIDAISLLSPLTGVGRYTYEISKCLQKMSHDKYEVFFNYGFYSKKLYGESKEATVVEEKLKSLKSFISKNHFLKKTARYFYAAFAKFYAKSFDIYFQPNFIPSANVKAKKVICTVHDFSFRLHPNWHPKERLDYFDENFHLVKKADHIITGSNFTKQEIIDYMQIPQDKISVIYHGVNHKLYKPYSQNELQETKMKFDLPNKFLLFVGSIEPRKNLQVLLKAYNLLSKEEKYALPLILVGFKGWENEEIMQEIKRNRNHIRYLGYLSESELAHIYNLAMIFVYPSLYEGFGLPPLEAMACGTAVVVSKVASMPEVCADAALYIDPLSPQEIKEKILLLANDETLREYLCEKGKKQAALFSWEKAAQEHFRVIEEYL